MQHFLLYGQYLSYGTLLGSLHMSSSVIKVTRMRYMRLTWL